MNAITIDDIARWSGVPSDKIKCLDDTMEAMRLACERQAQYEANCPQILNEWMDEYEKALRTAMKGQTDGNE